MSEDKYMQVGDTDYTDLFPAHKEDQPTFRSFWSSPEKFASGLAAIRKDKHWHTSGWEDRSDVEWSGTKTFDEAVDLVHTGWNEGAKKASRLLDRIIARYPLQKRPKVFGIAGAYPDVPRAIAGNPFNMFVPDPQRASRRPVITLLSDIAANCGHSGNEFINRAAVVAAIVDQIEAAGYACDVITYARSKGSSWPYGGQDGKFDYMGTCQVKNCNQPVDISRLAYGLGHPAMFRRLIFAEMGGHDFCKKLGHGLGSTYDFNEKEIKKLNHKNVFILPSIEKSDGAFKTEEKAETDGVEYIVKGLQHQKFPMFRSGGSMVLDTGPMAFIKDVEGPTVGNQKKKAA